MDLFTFHPPLASPQLAQLLHPGHLRLLLQALLPHPPPRSVVCNVPILGEVPSVVGCFEWYAGIPSGSLHCAPSEPTISRFVHLALGHSQSASCPAHYSLLEIRIILNSINHEDTFVAQQTSLISVHKRDTATDKAGEQYEDAGEVEGGTVRLGHVKDNPGDWRAEQRGNATGHYQNAKGIGQAFNAKQVGEED